MPFNDFHSTQHKRPVRNGSDIRLNMALTLEEVLTGIDKKIKFKRNIHCNSCNGNGSKNGQSLQTCQGCAGTGVQTRVIKMPPFGATHQSTTCSICNGEGKTFKDKCYTCDGNGILNKEETIDVQIPAGVLGGMNFHMQGYGHCVRGSGQPGNLIILILQNPHETFTRVNNNIHCDTFITVLDAMLGNEIEITTLNGRVKVKIDPGTENGKILRITGKGLPDINNPSVIGDLFVHISVFIPKEISETEKSLLNNLKDSFNFQLDKSKLQGMKGSFARMNEFKNLF